MGGGGEGGKREKRKIIVISKRTLLDIIFAIFSILLIDHYECTETRKFAFGCNRS